VKANTAKDRLRLSEAAVYNYYESGNSALSRLIGTYMDNAESIKFARKRLEKACKERPDDRKLLQQLANILEQLEAYPDLMELLDTAIARWPEDNELLISRSRISTFLGEFSNARTGYLKVLQRDSDHVEALCSMVRQGYGDEVGGLDRIQALLKNQGIKGAQRNILNYARARLLEQDLRFEEAFDVLREANGKRAANGGMDISAKQSGARAVIDDIDGDLVNRLSARGNDSERPIFIVGMPRSGTSLTEQILASHPDIYAAGERLFWGNTLGKLVRGAPKINGSMVQAIDQIHPLVWKNAGTDYLQQVAEIDADSYRITDKLPANFGLLPFIRIIFPRARIIHLRREPLATIASCISTPFAASSLAFSVEDWARFYGVYLALMDRWKPILGDQMLEVNYEELVSDLPTQAHRLIDFLGLEWNESCLHPELNRRAVRTASTQQVRHPVHTGAISAWRRYEVQLKALRPFIEESRAAISRD
jgi:tetratricopeptide (TPR) repeat protein